MRGWSELWHQFIATLTQQPVAVVLAVWMALALVVVMALEGLILNLFPTCVFRRYLEKMPDRKARSRRAAPAPASVPEPVPVGIAAPSPEPEPVVIEVPVAAPVPVPAKAAAAQAPAKRRPSRNPKKPASGPKPSRSPAIARRVAPRRERLSRGTPRLLKNPSSLPGA